MLLHGHQHSTRWYLQKRLQLFLALGLGALLWLVLAGPTPLVKSDLLHDTPTDGVKASSTGGGGSGGTAGDTGGGGGLVSVDFLGESLCPDCRHMVLDVLQPLFANGVAELMHLRYHAFGNAHNNSGGGGYVYQHGEMEGLYNRYMLCAQHFHPKQAEWFPYVKCFADNMAELDAKSDGCATDLRWNAGEIKACASGGELGKQLERDAAAATWAARPTKTFVPWILVNGVALGGDFERLERYVCAGAPAKLRPEACYQLPPDLQTMRG